MPTSTTPYPDSTDSNENEVECGDKDFIPHEDCGKVYF